MTRVEHLLWKLVEECAEVQHRVSKAARFSLNEIQPGNIFTNGKRIEHELCDLFAVLEMLVEEGVISIDSPVYQERIKTHKAQVEEYLKLSARLGTLV